MRILVVQETDWIDRNPVLHHRMLESLSLKGHEVTVVDFEIFWHRKRGMPIVRRRYEVLDCHKYFPDSKIRIVRPAMLRIRTLGRASWLVSNFTELRRMFAVNKPDVVVAYGISNARVASAIAHRNGVPFVYHLLDALHTLGEPEFLQPVARMVERSTIRRANRIVVVNNALRDYALSMGARADDLDVIPMGAAHGLSGTRGEQVRQALGIRPGDLVLLFVGWLYDFSGMRELATALAKRKSEFPNLKLLVVGEGDLLADLQEIRDRNDMADQLILTGQRARDEVADYVEASDVCLLPAHSNPTMRYIVPAKLTEYMEHGKPVIATRLPGVVAEFGELPGVIYINSSEEAFDAAARLMSQSDPRGYARSLGRTCFEFMQRRETWDEVTARFERVLENAIADQKESR